MIKELLSVIIPTYNRDVDMLQKSVESVLNQDYHSIEIFIVDDNEDFNDYSEGIKDYCNEIYNLRYIKQNGNKGACAARNLGIDMSNGEYVGFLDDDDRWGPTKATKQINKLKGNNNIGMVFCKGVLIDNNYSPPKKVNYFNAEMFQTRVTFNDLLVSDYIGTTSQAIIKKKCFSICGGFDEKLLARQDYEMWIRISKFFDIVGIDDFLFEHYIHEGEQISKNSKNSLQGYKRIYELYKRDFKQNKSGKASIMKNILHSSKVNREYGTLFKFLFQIVLIDPRWVLQMLIKKIGQSFKLNI